MNSVETRFAHLLQPIRDLLKNWDVDLATQLGEYLEEVRLKKSVCLLTKTDETASNIYLHKSKISDLKACVLITRCFNN